MLSERGPGKTLCPSEVARAVAGADGDWRGQMPMVHAAVDEMLTDGDIVLSWQGRRLATREGAYRIGRPS